MLQTYKKPSYVYALHVRLHLNVVSNNQLIYGRKYRDRALSAYKYYWILNTAYKYFWMIKNIQGVHKVLHTFQNVIAK